MAVPKSQLRPKVKLPRIRIPNTIYLGEPKEWLAHSDSMYKRAVEAMNEGLWIGDKNETTLYVNPKIVELTGYTPQELIGRPAFKFWSKKTENTIREVNRSLRRRGIKSSYEGEVVSKTGEIKPVLVSGTPLPGGGTIAIVSDLRDIKENEAKLQARMRELSVLYMVNAHTRMILPLKTVLKRITHDLTYAARLPEEAYCQIIFDDRQLNSKGRPIQLAHKIQEKIVVRGQARGRIILGYAKYLPSLGRNPFTKEERKLLKAATNTLNKHIGGREVLERYERLIKKSNFGIYIIENGFLRFVNPAFCRMFGYREKELVDKAFTKIVSGCVCHDKLLSSPKKSLSCITQGHPKKGGIIEVEMIAQPILYHSKNAILGTIHDVTKLKKAEAQLKTFNEELQRRIAERTEDLEIANKRLLSLNEMKDEFIAVTSHELRSPLTSIRGYLSFLTEKSALEQIPDELRGYVLKAYNNTEVLSSLMNNILDASRLEVGRLTLYKSTIDALQLIRSVLENLEIQAAQSELVFKFSNLTGLPELPLYLDEVRMRQVLRNILQNALRFSPKGNSIEISIRLQDGVAVIGIEDHGIGIPESDLDKIFDKYMQVKQSNDRFKGGTGLGLYISKKIVEMHGGKIIVNSTVGSGSHFIVQLPLHG